MRINSWMTLKNMTSLIKHYNATRAGGTSDNDWCDHILGYYRHAMNYKILEYLKNQGYDISK